MNTGLYVKCFLFCFLHSAFCFLPCSAQYSVFSCPFEEWTNDKPNGWKITPSNTVISKYTPAFTGSYSCKLEHINAVTMVTTETFPIYWGKKYVLYFAAKILKGRPKITFEIINNTGWHKLSYFKQEIDIDAEWKHYQIEFTSAAVSQFSTFAPTSSYGNQLYIDARRNASNIGVELVIDYIKLVAKDETMQFNFLEANNIKAYIDPIAPFVRFDEENVQNNINYFEVPKHSGKSTTYGLNIWLGGLDEQGNLHLAAQNHCQYGRDLYMGPVTQDYDSIVFGEKMVSDNFIQKYYYTWKVTKEEIEYHKKHYSEQGYVMPWGIAHWPAHGRTAFGESEHLAPYKSVSGNGWYAPWLGDYPLIRGDEAVYFITNDETGPHIGSMGTPLGVEIMGMAYAYNSPDSALFHTIFMSYVIKNRSLNNYNHFYIGFFNDLDIGYGWDDYAGCDTLLNMIYGYNAGSRDGNGEACAYGEHPPAQGVMFLNQKITTALFFNNGPYSPNHGLPYYTIDYYNFFQAIWKDGTPVTLWGDGYNPESTDYTHFMFSGDPVMKAGWTEITPNGPGSVANEGKDKFAMMSSGPFTLPAGETICVDIALPFARDYGGDHISSVALLKQRAKIIQQFYDSQHFGNNCANPINNTENRIYNNKLLLYPNPSHGQFTVTCQYQLESFELYDGLGRKVFSETPKLQTIHINSSLPPGLYFYRAVLQNNTIRTGKIIIQ